MPTIRFDRKPPGVDAVEWYQDTTGAFTAGYWTHEGGVIECDYTEHEFCLLLAGKVRWPWGVAWGLFFELGMMTLPPVPMMAGPFGVFGF